MKGDAVDLDSLPGVNVEDTHAATPVEEELVSSGGLQGDVVIDGHGRGEGDIRRQLYGVSIRDEIVERFTEVCLSRHLPECGFRERESAQECQQEEFHRFAVLQLVTE